MINKLRTFLNDRRGISAMQDAVLFCVMVSIAGAVLVPAFTSTIPQETHLRVEQQETVEEILVSFLSSRATSINYTIGEKGTTVRETIASTPIFQSLNSFATKRYVLHQAYGTLITECLASQMYLFGYRINPIATDYDAVLKEKIQGFFNNSLGNDYEYHLMARWQPLKGIPIGGNLSIGPPSPSDATTAETEILMPFPPRFKTASGKQGLLFSKETVAKNIDLHTIQQTVEKYQEGKYTRQKATEILYQNISQHIKQLYLSGSELLPSVINITLQHVNLNAGMLETSTADIDALDTIMNQTTGGRVYKPQIEDILTASLSGFSSTIETYDDGWATAYSRQLKNDEGIQEKPATLMNFTWKLAEKEIEDNNLLQPYIEDEIELLLSTTSDDAAEEYIDWLYQMVDLSHAEISLSIWRA